MKASEETFNTNAEQDAETARLVEGIEKTRADISGAVAALESRLNPTELRGKLEGELQHVEDKVRQVVREQLADAKALVKEELVEAKTLLQTEISEAEAKVKQGLKVARETLKHDLANELEGAEARIRKGVLDAKDGIKSELRSAFTEAKTSVRAATLGNLENLATKTGDIMNDTRDTLIDTIRSNPLPTALAGVGIAWLLMNRSSSAKHNFSGGRRSAAWSHDANSHAGFQPSDRSAGDFAGDIGNSLRHAKDMAGDFAGGAAHRASEWAHQASESAGSFAHQASDIVGSAIQGAGDMASRVASLSSDAATTLMHGARDASSSVVHGADEASAYVAAGVRTQARRVEQGFQTTLEENPLALGAAAALVGAVIGYALPRTHKEDELMGSMRDEVLQRAETATHDAAGMVGKFAEKSLETAKGLLSDTITGSSEMASTGQTTATK